MNIYLHKKLTDSPKVRTINGSPGLYAIQISDSEQDSLHCTRRQLTAWMSAILAQIDCLEREPVVVSS